MKRFALLASFVLAALAVAPASARASQVYGDLDRDGRRDLVSVDPAQSSIVRIWLSSTGSLSLVRAPHPIVKLGVFDLDGDGRPELLAADAAAGLHVWRTNARGHVHPYAPRRPQPRARNATPAGVDDDDNAADVPFQGTTLSAPLAESSLPASLGDLATSFTAFGTSTPLVIGRVAGAKAPRGPPR
jgi:hypothetical protein